MAEAGEKATMMSKLAKAGNAIKDAGTKAYEMCQKKLAGKPVCATVNTMQSKIRSAASDTNPVDTARNVIQAVGAVDPTGIADCAAAYMYPKCDAKGYADGW